jgi:hypothetical protein
MGAPVFRGMAQPGVPLLQYAGWTPRRQNAELDATRHEPFQIVELYLPSARRGRSDSYPRVIDGIRTGLQIPPLQGNNLIATAVSRDGQSCFDATEEFHALVQIAEPWRSACTGVADGPDDQAVDRPGLAAGPHLKVITQKSSRDSEQGRLSWVRSQTPVYEQGLPIRRMCHDNESGRGQPGNGGNRIDQLQNATRRLPWSKDGPVAVIVAVADALLLKFMALADSVMSVANGARFTRAPFAYFTPGASTCRSSRCASSP